MAGFWLEAVAVLAVLYVALKIWYQRKVQRFKDLGVNFNPPTFLLGNTSESFFAKRHPAYTIKDVYDAFPDDRFAVYFEMTHPVILLRDLELIKNICIKNFDNFPDHRLLVDEEHDVVFGKSLFSLKGEKWRQMRSTMKPAFTPSRLKKMSVLLIKAANQMTDHFRDQIKDLNKNGGDQVMEIDGKKVFTAYFNDLMAMAGFGLNINSFKDEENSFLNESIKMTDLNFWRYLKFVGFAAIPKIMKMLKLAFIEKETVVFFKDIVVNTIKHREEHNIHTSDFLDLIIQAKKGILKDDTTSMKTNSFVIEEDSSYSYKHDSTSPTPVKMQWTDDDLTAQATFFMVAGLDTGASSTGFMFYELAKYPDIQKRLQREIDEALEEHGEISYDMVQTLEYLNMVVSESMRKYLAGIPTFDRVCYKDYNIGPPRPGARPYTIKKGDGVAISAIGIHRDPKYWPNPLKFDPERFSKENRHKIVPYTFIPFGLGPRICIANRFAEVSMKLAVASMLSVFDIVPTDKTPDVLEFSTKTLTLKATDYFYGLRLRE